MEAQSVYTLREAYARIEPLAMLWSLAKDSNVMIWLARKAFFRTVPFPVMHVDTGKKFKEMYEFRDRYATEWKLDFLREVCPPIEDIDASLPPGKVEELEEISARRGMAIEWPFVLDAFQAERDQAVTIDTTQIWFKTALRDYVIIDAPGHREFLKNMVSSAGRRDRAVHRRLRALRAAGSRRPRGRHQPRGRLGLRRAHHPLRRAGLHAQAARQGDVATMEE